MKFTKSPYETMMREIPRREKAPLQKAPKGTPCEGCSYWRGLVCVSCYRSLLKTGGRGR